MNVLEAIGDVADKISEEGRSEVANMLSVLLEGSTQTLRSTGSTQADLITESVLDAALAFAQSAVQSATRANVMLNAKEPPHIHGFHFDLMYAQGQPITENYLRCSGADRLECVPANPAGLDFDADTGRLSGVPRGPCITPFTVLAHNQHGTNSCGFVLRLMDFPFQSWSERRSADAVQFSNQKKQAEWRIGEDEDAIDGADSKGTTPPGPTAWTCGAPLPKHGRYFFDVEVHVVNFATGSTPGGEDIEPSVSIGVASLREPSVKLNRPPPPEGAEGWTVWKACAKPVICTDGEVSQLLRPAAGALFGTQNNIARVEVDMDHSVVTFYRGSAESPRVSLLAQFPISLKRGHSVVPVASAAGAHVSLELRAAGWCQYPWLGKEAPLSAALRVVGGGVLQSNGYFKSSSSRNGKPEFSAINNSGGVMSGQDQGSIFWRADENLWGIHDSKFTVLYVASVSPIAPGQPPSYGWRVRTGVAPVPHIDYGHAGHHEDDENENSENSDDRKTSRTASSAQWSSPITLKTGEQPQDSSASQAGLYWDVQAQSTIQILSVSAGAYRSGDRDVTIWATTTKDPSADHEQKGADWTIVGKGLLVEKTSTRVELTEPLVLEEGTTCGMYIHTDIGKDGLMYATENDTQEDEHIKLIPWKAAFDKPFSRVADDRKFLPAGAVEYAVCESGHAAGAGSAGASAEPSGPAFAGLVPGIQTSFPDDFLSGWTEAYDAPYNEKTTKDQLLDNVPPSAKVVFVGARNAAGDIVLGAMGLRDEVMQITSSKSKAHAHNGLFWYFHPGQSFGFAPVEDISLSSADTKDDHADERLSWHCDKGGGYRAGSRSGSPGDLNSNSEWRKLLYYRIDDYAPQNTLMSNQTFVYGSDFDDAGLLYFLGTNGGSSAWQNPAKIGLVKVSSAAGSAVGNFKLDVTDRHNKDCSTGTKRKDTELTVELPEPFELSHYTIKHGYSSASPSGTGSLRNWELQGSNDGKAFATIMAHVDDTSLDKGFATHTWEVDTKGERFKFFRIQMTGPNSGSDKEYYITVCGLEFYGSAVRAQVSRPDDAGSKQSSWEFSALTPVSRARGKLSNVDRTVTGERGWYWCTGPVLPEHSSKTYFYEIEVEGSGILSDPFVGFGVLGTRPDSGSGMYYLKSKANPAAMHPSNKKAQGVVKIAAGTILRVEMDLGHAIMRVYCGGKFVGSEVVAKSDLSKALAPYVAVLDSATTLTLKASGVVEQPSTLALHGVLPRCVRPAMNWHSLGTQTAGQWEGCSFSALTAHHLEQFRIAGRFTFMLKWIFAQKISDETEDDASSRIESTDVSRMTSGWNTAARVLTNASSTDPVAGQDGSGEQDFIIWSQVKNPLSTADEEMGYVSFDVANLAGNSGGAFRGLSTSPHGVLSGVAMQSPSYVIGQTGALHNDDEDNLIAGPVDSQNMMIPALFVELFVLSPLPPSVTIGRSVLNTGSPPAKIENVGLWSHTTNTLSTRVGHFGQLTASPAPIVPEFNLEDGPSRSFTVMDPARYPQALVSPLSLVQPSFFEVRVNLDGRVPVMSPFSFDADNMASSIKLDGERKIRGLSKTGYSCARMAPALHASTGGKQSVDLVIRRRGPSGRSLGCEAFVGICTEDHAAWESKLLDPPNAYGLEDDNASTEGRWFFPAYAAVDGRGYRSGDRITLEVDFDDDKVRIFRNRGTPHEAKFEHPGFGQATVYFAVSLYHRDTSVELLPSASASIGQVAIGLRIQAINGTVSDAVSYSSAGAVGHQELHVSSYDEAMWKAIDGRSIEQLEAAINNGADLNFLGSNELVASNRGVHKVSCLEYAAHLDFIPGLKLLLERGANVSLRGSHGWTALMQAACCARFECIRLLMPEVTNQGGEDVKAAIEVAQSLKHSDIVTLIKLLRTQYGSNKSGARGPVVEDKQREISLTVSSAVPLGVRFSKGLLSAAPLKVASIVPGEQAVPLEKAGLIRKGDCVTHINGIAVHGMGLPAIKALMKSAEQVQLRLSRRIGSRFPLLPPAFVNGDIVGVYFEPDVHMCTWFLNGHPVAAIELEALRDARCVMPFVSSTREGDQFEMVSPPTLPESIGLLSEFICPSDGYDASARASTCHDPRDVQGILVVNELNTSAPTLTHSTSGSTRAFKVDHFTRFNAAGSRRMVRDGETSATFYEIELHRGQDVWQLFFQSSVHAEAVLGQLRTTAAEEAFPEPDTAGSSTPNLDNQVSRSVVPKNALVVCGGREPGTSNVHVDVLDMANNVWDEEFMPDRLNAAFVSVNGGIYATGGVDPDGRTVPSMEHVPLSASIVAESRDMFGTANDTAEPPRMRQARRNHSLVLAGSSTCLVAIGGVGPDGKSLGSVEMLDLRSKPPTWKLGPALQQSRSHVAIASVGNRVFVFGGWCIEQGSQRCMDTVETASYPSGSRAGAVRWVISGTMPASRACAAAIEFGGYVYLIGGYNALGEPQASVYRHDPVSGLWDRARDMSHARAEHAVFVVDGCIIVIGGADGNGGVGCPTEAFDPAQQSWSIIERWRSNKQGLQTFLLPLAPTSRSQKPLNQSQDKSAIVSVEGTRFPPTGFPKVGQGHTSALFGLARFADLSGMMHDTKVAASALISTSSPQKQAATTAVSQTAESGGILLGGSELWAHPMFPADEVFENVSVANFWVDSTSFSGAIGSQMQPRWSDEERSQAIHVDDQALKLVNSLLFNAVIRVLEAGIWPETQPASIELYRIPLRAGGQLTTAVVAQDAPSELQPQATSSSTLTIVNDDAVWAAAERVFPTDTAASRNTSGHSTSAATAISVGLPAKAALAATTLAGVTLTKSGASALAAMVARWVLQLALATGRSTSSKADSVQIEVATLSGKLQQLDTQRTELEDKLKPFIGLRENAKAEHANQCKAAKKKRPANCGHCERSMKLKVLGAVQSPNRCEADDCPEAGKGLAKGAIFYECEACEFVLCGSCCRIPFCGHDACTSTPLGYSVIPNGVKHMQVGQELFFVKLFKHDHVTDDQSNKLVAFLGEDVVAGKSMCRVRWKGNGEEHTVQIEELLLSTSADSEPPLNTHCSLHACQLPGCTRSVDKDRSFCTPCAEQHMDKFLPGEEVTLKSKRMPPSVPSSYNGVYFNLTAPKDKAVLLKAIYAGSESGSDSTGKLYMRQGSAKGKCDSEDGWKVICESVALSRQVAHKTDLGTPVMIPPGATMGFFIHGTAHNECVGYCDPKTGWSEAKPDLKYTGIGRCTGSTPFKFSSEPRQLCGGFVYQTFGDPMEKEAELVKIKVDRSNLADDMAKIQAHYVRGAEILPRLCDTAELEALFESCMGGLSHLESRGSLRPRVRIRSAPPNVYCLETSNASVRTVVEEVLSKVVAGGAPLPVEWYTVQGDAAIGVLPDQAATRQCNGESLLVALRTQCIDAVAQRFGSTRAIPTPPSSFGTDFTPPQALWPSDGTQKEATLFVRMENAPWHTGWVQCHTGPISIRSAAPDSGALLVMNASGTDNPIIYHLDITIDEIVPNTDAAEIQWRLRAGWSSGLHPEFLCRFDSQRATLDFCEVWRTYASRMHTVASSPFIDGVSRLQHHTDTHAQRSLQLHLEATRETALATLTDVAAVLTGAMAQATKTGTTRALRERLVRRKRRILEMATFMVRLERDAAPFATQDAASLGQASLRNQVTPSKRLLAKLLDSSVLGFHDVGPGNIWELGLEHTESSVTIRTVRRLQQNLRDTKITQQQNDAEKLLKSGLVSEEQYTAMMTSIDETNGGSMGADVDEIERHLKVHVANRVGEMQKSLINERNGTAQAFYDTEATWTIAKDLGFDDAHVLKYCYWMADLDLTIGLEPVVRWCHKQFNDFLQRVGRLGERRQNSPHVLLSGPFGSGKTTGTHLICQLVQLMDGAKPGAGRKAARPPFKAMGPREQPDNLEKHTPEGMREILDPKNDDKTFKKKKVYLVRLGKDYKPRGGYPTDPQEGGWLEALQAKQSFAVLSGESADVTQYSLLFALRKYPKPHPIEIHNLSYETLARLALLEIHKLGYRLSLYAHKYVEAGEAQMCKILRLKLDEVMLNQRNAYLARDLVQMAISHKNDRASKGSSLGSLASAMILSHASFEVDLVGKAELDAGKREVQLVVDSMIGWGDALTTGAQDSSGAYVLSPKAFFEKARMTFKSIEDVNMGIGEQPNSWPGNVWVTGSTGTGKTQFVRLAIKYLRWHSALRSDVVIEVNGSELLSGDASSTIKSWFAQADGGALFIDEAYSMLPDEEVGNQGREAVQHLLREADAQKDAVLVILAGYRDKMNTFMSSDQGLSGRFPCHVHCDDYTPDELTGMIEQRAFNRGFKLGFERGDLVKFIKERFIDSQVDASNGRLAMSLAESAIIKRHHILEKSGKLRTEDEQDLMEVLEPLDFGIGKEMGAGVDERAAVEKEIEDLIGMEEGKEWFRKFKAKVDFVEKTQDRSVLQTCLNLVITGNPGTGKTTYARLIFKVLHAYGILPRDNFVEKNGLDLKGQHVGSTAPKVKKIIKEAMGGCLFLDEAYALAEGGNDGGDVYAQEAIRTLLTEVENNRTNLMVVFAGYKDKIGGLMRLDPGLDRRFPERLDLRDYSAKELAQICEVVARKKFGKTFADGLLAQLAEHIENFYSKEISEQNGGLAVNLCEAAVDRQVRRLVAMPGFADWNSETAKEKGAVLVVEDFDATSQRTLGEANSEKEAVQKEVDELIGMENIKEYLNNLKEVVEYVENGGSATILKTNLNMILTGNPGTGKTTTARLIARFLCAYGVLPRTNFVEKNGLELKGRYVGSTAPTVKEAVAQAMGGCLFVDEAYALAQSQDSFSGEAVRTLLTEVENNRTNLLVVLAGYKDKMKDLLDMDPGLPRRFATRIHIDDYSCNELARICEHVAKSRFGFTFPNYLLDALEWHLIKNEKHRVSSENGGLSVNLTEAAARRLATRISSSDSATQQQLTELTVSYVSTF